MIMTISVKQLNSPSNTMPMVNYHNLFMAFTDNQHFKKSFLPDPHI